MEDKETILQLFQNYIDNPHEETIEYKELSKQVLQYEDELHEELTEEQKQKFDRIIELENELLSEESKQTFIYAFSLATRLFVEGLKEDKKESLYSN